MGSRSQSVAARMSWPDMCRSDQFRGRWVALDNVRYAPGTSKPAEADVVDADEDLADLCARMRESDRTSCAIVFCTEDSFPTGSVRRPSPIPPRPAHHR
jgi:hypothetical protein